MNKKFNQQLNKGEIYLFVKGLQKIFNELDFNKYYCNKIFEDYFNEEFPEIEVMLQKHINKLKNE